MFAQLPASFRRLSLAAGLVPALLAAQTADAQKLDQHVVTATRVATDITTLGTSVDFISAAELERQQRTTLRDALSLVPGAPVFPSGANGAVSSLFLRGANSNQTLFLVDSVRFNDSNTEYFVALGGMTVGASDQIEIARGPQSTLYGSEAVGGVVSLSAQRGSGAPTQKLSVEGGSFRTGQASVSAQAGDARRAYSFTASGGRTDNDRANNDFKSASYVLRLDRRLSDTVAIGATWRGFNAEYGSPGASIGWGANDPDNRERESNQLGTVFAELTHSPALHSRATLAAQHRRYVAEMPDPFGDTIAVTKNRRALFDWQTVWQPAGAHRVTGGFTVERNATRNDGFVNVDDSQNQFALFLQEEFSPVENVFLTAGLRYDEFETFGGQTTGKATAAWLVAQKALKLRASYGTGFRAPSFLDLYGRSFYYVGNPDLQPEKARGWDLGADYYLPGGRGSLGVTWFEQRYDNLIAYDFAVFPATVRNIDDARARGVEFSGKVRLPGAIDARLAYTYLDARNLTSQSRLVRRPRHAGALDLWRDFGAWSAGAAATFAKDREDVHAADFNQVDSEDYVVVRVYAAWNVTDRLTLKARVENALNERYEVVHGYPQLGFGAYVGAEWRF